MWLYDKRETLLLPSCQLIICNLLDYREAVDYSVSVGFARLEDGARELRMIRRIREHLRLKSDGVAGTGVNLKTRMVVENLHLAS